MHICIRTPISCFRRILASGLVQLTDWGICSYLWSPAIAEIGSLVRSSDLVARLGGDEFAVLIKGNDTKSASRYLADRFTQAMREPVICTGVELTSSASIGVAVGRSGLDTVEHVVHQADMAMYEAKRSGGARYCVAS